MTAASTVTPPTRTTAASAFTLGSSDSFIQDRDESTLSAPLGSAYASQKEKLPSLGTCVLNVSTPASAANWFMAAQPCQQMSASPEVIFVVASPKVGAMPLLWAMICDRRSNTFALSAFFT